MSSESLQKIHQNLFRTLIIILPANLSESLHWSECFQDSHRSPLKMLLIILQSFSSDLFQNSHHKSCTNLNIFFSRTFIKILPGFLSDFLQDSYRDPTRNLIIILPGFLSESFQDAHQNSSKFLIKNLSEFSPEILHKSHQNPSRILITILKGISSKLFQDSHQNPTRILIRVLPRFSLEFL